MNPLNIRPILGDDETYTIKSIITPAPSSGNPDADDLALAKKFITQVIKSRKEYKGSGSPVLFTTEDNVTNMLLIEDTTGRAIYEDINKLKTKMRVSDIIAVPPMENQMRTDDAEEFDYFCMGILVNLTDYNVGANRGGQVSFFDDFDLNYNKQEYLIETRCSGALVQPFSAISFEKKVPHAAG